MKGKKGKIILSVSIIIGLICAVSVGALSVFSKINHVEIDKSDEALGISEDNKLISTVKAEELDNIEKVEENETIVETEEEEEDIFANVPDRNDIITVALFGIDSRKEGSFKGRSDSIMLATVDFARKEIRLSSLMRDTKVKIENRGYEKLGHAYAYGSAPLGIKTINQNFGTDIRDYATVDFFTLAKIIDVLGGVEIEVQEREIPWINSTIKEVARIQKVEPPLIKEPGLQTLNGAQAVGYARLRKVGNSDFDRVKRQRLVLTEMIKKIEEIDITDIPALITEVLPNVETSMDASTILQLALSYFKAGGGFTIETQTFPVQGYYWNDIAPNGQWMLGVDLNVIKNQVQDFVYKDIKPTSK